MLLVVWFILNQTTFGCQGVLIAVKRFDLLFRFCLLSNQELFLLWGQITPTQLILADPCQCFITVRKFSLDDFKRNKWIFLKDLIARVSVNNVAVPSDDRIQHTLFLEEVFLNLDLKKSDSKIARWYRLALLAAVANSKIFVQKNNRPLQVELENGRSRLQNVFQIWRVH